MPNPIDDLDLTAVLAAPVPLQGVPGKMFGSVQAHYLRSCTVLRGYLADPDLVWTDRRDPANPNPYRLWRIYLSAGMDVFVDFFAMDAVRVTQHVPSDPDELTENVGMPHVQAVTLWLNRIPRVMPAPWPEPPALIPRRYFIARELHASTGFMSGALLDDVMEAADSRAPAWPEQGYGGQGWPHTAVGTPCHH